MEFIKQERIRRYYAPLIISATLKVETPDSGIGQVYDPNSGNFNPDREITPLVISPNIEASAVDGSWTQQKVANLIGEKKWFVNGVDISTLLSWQGKYEKIVLHFEVILPDERQGITIPVKTNSVALSTLDMSKDTFAISFSTEENFMYNPFLDKLLMYDYKSANGIAAGNRNDALDENSYKRIIEMMVTKGGVSVNTGYTLSLKRVTNNMTLENISQSGDFFHLNLASNKIALDMRMLETGSYVIIVTDDETNKEVARKQFSVSRQSPSYDIDIFSTARISQGDRLHRNKVTVQYGKSIIEHPAPILRFLWLTETATEGLKEWNEGDKTVIDILRAGVGFTYINDSMDLQVGSEMKGIFERVTDENGEVFTDENGEIFITN